MPQNVQQDDQRVLILAENEHAALQLKDTLKFYGHTAKICLDSDEMCHEVHYGAGALLIAKKFVTENHLPQLITALGHQPSWSHLPVLILLPEGEEISAEAESFGSLEILANLNMLEAPIRTGQLIRLVRSALAYRQKQYQSQDLIKELEKCRVEGKEANRAKSDFLANMSHEIRTPLGAILGFAELLMDAGISKSEKQDYMIAARRNGQMLSALIDDILDFSKAEAGRLEIAKIEFSIHELLSEVVSALEPVASKKGLPLTVVKPEDADFIVGDPIRIKQILVNIVGNAIKFTSHGGVDVRLSVATGTAGSLLSIEVEDTGIGIAPEKTAQLFRPFMQADTSTTRRFGGTGLGLVLSQRLARAMGGDLKLDWSIPGGGSRFVTTLPVQVARSTTSYSPVALIRPKEVSGQPLMGSKVLLVDDSLDNQMLISRILKLLGAEVDLASDGLEGMEKAMSESYDVILMDLQMPRLGGVEATRLLRAKGYSRPIVALTAHSLQGDRQRCLNVGCTDYLTKPIQRSVLVQVLERISSRAEGAARH